MTYVYETKISGKDVVVEYVQSSVTYLLKVVDMTVDGKYHRLNWMSKEGKANLIDELEKDYLLNNSVIRKKKVVNPPIVGIPTK